MITVVSGLPRSGTSLMMQMLAAGGMSVLADDSRPADANNPRGYFEDRRVKSLETDSTWLTEADGRAVKIVSLLLYQLRPEFEYRVLFMRRKLDEVLRSQQAMLGSGVEASAPAGLLAHFERHLDALGEWLSRQAHIQSLDVEHAAAIRNPKTVATDVAAFLQIPLDVSAMTSVVDSSLYRQR